MRRCSVLQIVASSRGGGAEVVRCLVKGLDSSRFESTVAMPDDGGQLDAADFERVGARCLYFDIASGFSVRECLRLRRFVRKGGFDIIHCHGARAALWGRLAAIGPRRPKTIFAVHGLSLVHHRTVKRTPLLFLNRALQSSTDITLCDSDREAADVIRHGIAPAERVEVVQNGVDLDRFDQSLYPRSEARSALALDDKRPLVVTVCRLDRPRDFHTLLRAMKYVVAELPLVKLLIVGGGPYRQAIEEQVRELNLEQSVQLLGTVRDVARILAAADAFVLATQGWEGLPLAPLEAQAMGLPVVISDVGSNRLAVQDGVTGLVVAPRQVEALADALVRLLADPLVCQQMGQLGRIRVVDEFSAQRMARDTVRVYRRLVHAC